LKRLEEQQIAVRPSIPDDEILRRKRHLESSSYPPPPPSNIPFSQVSDIANNGLLYAEAAAASASKRQLDMLEEDGYELDPRVPDNDRRVRMEPASKRSRLAESEYPPPPVAMSIFSEPSEVQLGDQGGIRNPISSFMDPDLEALTQRSKEVSMSMRKPKEPQSRTPWSREDMKLLIRAVDLFKCKWSTIEKEIKNGVIKFEHPRDQQALRDKARLLKQDFLK
jgi:hypothetical protein